MAMSLVPDPPDDEDYCYSPDEALQFLNKRYCWIKTLGAIICTEGDHVDFRNISGFKVSYNNRKVRLTDKKTMPMGDFWLQSFDRRTRECMGLWAHPKVAPVDGFNLWRGFAVEPKEGDCSLLIEHIYNVVASGNEELADYIIMWIAWMFQNPGIPAETVIALRGTEGVGKSLLGKALRKIIGYTHSTQITDHEQFIAGRFNKYMQDCVFLFGDECYWAGSKSLEGKLKGLITESTIRIEPKGIDVYEVNNALHMMLSSNNEWIVPAGPDARRFVVADVSSARIGDVAYFNALHVEMDNGGREAFLYKLLNLKLDLWHPRTIIHSQALDEQKELSLPPEKEWLLSLLDDGTLPVESSLLKASAINWRSSQAIRNHANSTVPAMKNISDKRLGLMLKSIGAERKRNTTGNNKGWVFPTLAQARELWNKNYFSKAWPVESWDKGQ